MCDLVARPYARRRLAVVADYIGDFDARITARSDDDLPSDSPRQTYPKIYFDAGQTVTVRLDVCLPSHFSRALPRPAPGRPLGHSLVAECVVSMLRGTFRHCRVLTIDCKSECIERHSRVLELDCARVLPGMKRGHSFHLHLVNADDPTCGRCHSNSSLFEMAQTGSGAAGRQSATPESQMLSLGLGLGLEMPLRVLLAAFATWFWMCRGRGMRRNVDGRMGKPGTDYMQVIREQKVGEMELQGQAICELSGLEVVIEAPSETTVVKLEGSPGRSKGRSWLLLFVWKRTACLRFAHLSQVVDIFLPSCRIHIRRDTIVKLWNGGLLRFVPFARVLSTAVIHAHDGMKYARSNGSLATSHASQSDLVVLIPIC